MGRPGRLLERDISVEDMIALLYKHGGVITRVAKDLCCTRDAVYDYIDVYPELQEAREKSCGRLGDYEVETAYEVIDKLMSKVDEDASNAFKAAQLVSTRSKRSRYYKDDTAEKTVTLTLSELKAAIENGDLSQK